MYEEMGHYKHVTLICWFHRSGWWATSFFLICKTCTTRSDGHKQNQADRATMGRKGPLHLSSTDTEVTQKKPTYFRQIPLSRRSHCSGSLFESLCIDRRSSEHEEFILTFCCVLYVTLISEAYIKSKSVAIYFLMFVNLDWLGRTPLLQPQTSVFKSIRGTNQFS